MRKSKMAIVYRKYHVDKANYVNRKAKMTLRYTQVQSLLYAEVSSL